MSDLCAEILDIVGLQAPLASLFPGHLFTFIFSSVPELE